MDSVVSLGTWQLKASLGSTQVTNMEWWTFQLGPNMRQTRVNDGRPGYEFSTAECTQSGGTLRRSGNPGNQPLKMFQFIIGELSFSSSLMSSDLHLFIALKLIPLLVFQTE